MKDIDELTRARLTRELSRGEKQPSPERYRRITKLQRAILDQYGRRGAEFIMAQQGLLAGVDDSCPWRVAELEPAAAIEQVFGALASRLPRFITALKEGVRWVIPARRDATWVLVYVTDCVLRDGRPHFQLVVGGAPDPAPQLSPRACYAGWRVPASLRTLCQVHDGIAAGAQGVLAARRMADLGEIMEGIEEERPAASHACRDLLEFHPDGAGNCQAFFRRAGHDPDPETVFWDHEANALSGAVPFFEYVDQMLAAGLRDAQRI